ncbi:uncharacterized protein LACBIDRAFT_317699 [Laccaria bicolor S238N-H82]|uniref:Predicted protein n=1 Tax=Laccaria bicolor (strain S238N-H82 / ATCC MYA-4686) TaxID=486041 RepID=B0E277_LACBS|nr:uncharacterized protein LACBIDRAFT_317699 [Laccaria bicolor S238N-H82]EDQ99058.1 predicted protein [Laccaria bicolor S238N-H82]|eukprot:XP_001890301.1 predicted protein [Laccaria bicolor S238N-H82]
MGLDDDISTQNGLLSATCPSSTYHNYQPCSIPRLTFTDVSYKFPHPPIPTPSSLCSCASPTSSASSSDSSPCSRFSTLPPTPSTSDDEFALPSPRFNPRRAAIKPLVIAKHNGSPSMSPSPSPFNDSECPISATIQNFNGTAHPTFPIKESFYESDEGESDSEWYNKEFSKILTLPSSPTTHQKPSRPESMFVPHHSVRYSKPLLLTPCTTSPVSPAFSSKRQSRRSFIPNYPSPPIPTLIRTSSASSSTSSSSKMNHISSPFPTSPKSFHSRAPYTPASSSSRRPPPRSSIPADCGYFETDDQGSVFSLSLYEDDIEMDMDLRSACSFSSESDDFRFDVEMDLHVEGEEGADEYPPSLPSSPNSADLDIATSFEHTPTSSPSPSPMLKSKWSSSTIGSIREEHERRGPSAKLRLYFGGGGGGAGKRGSKNSSNKVVPQTPKSPASSTMTKSSSPRGYGYGHGRHSSCESDVMIIGYGHGHGVRRRGSVTPTVSDAGSDDSALSCASSGLRRKPIPLMLLSGSA